MQAFLFATSTQASAPPAAHCSEPPPPSTQHKHQSQDCILAGRLRGDNHTWTPFLIIFLRGGLEGRCKKPQLRHLSRRSASVVLGDSYLLCIFFPKPVFAIWEMCVADKTFRKLLEAGVSEAARCRTSRSFRLIPTASLLQTEGHFLFRFPNLTGGPKSVWLPPVQRVPVGLCRVLSFPATSSLLPSGTILTAVYLHLQTKNGFAAPRLSHRPVVALPL